jgi:glycosyltransferase involved in cell wall biosynthesis
MRAWLITLGEPLPVDGAQPRLLRTGFLSRALRKRGHSVTWFSNRFDHFLKSHRLGPDVRATADRERLVLLNSRGYQSNVSFERFLDHRDLVRDFETRASTEELPDLIVASMPTIDLCLAAVSFGHRIGVPTVIDIRDLWPDSVWDLAPARLRPLMPLLTWPFERQLRSALKQATAITSHVQDFIDWAQKKTSPLAGQRVSGVFPLGYEALSGGTDTSGATDFWAAQGLDLNGKDFLAVYIGTISRQCEFGHVVDAARALADEKIKFVLCGAGDKLSELQAHAKSAVNMIVPGWCTHSQTSALLERASAGLMPYRRLPNFLGAVPNKALEYMAYGVPIVWRLEEGALARLIHEQDIGLTYDGTSEGLVRAMKDLMQSEELGNITAARSKTLFAQRFQATAVYEEMVLFLESLRAGNGIGEVLVAAG